MNRVWKIIEERKSGMRGSGYSSRKMSGMSSRKGGDYEEGVKDGICAAIDTLEEYIKDWDKD